MSAVRNRRRVAVPRIVAVDEVLLLVVAALTIVDTMRWISDRPYEWRENVTSSSVSCWGLVLIGMLIGIWIRTARRMDDVPGLRLLGVVLALMFWEVVLVVGVAHVMARAT